MRWGLVQGRERGSGTSAQKGTSKELAAREALKSLEVPVHD